MRLCNGKEEESSETLLFVISKNLELFDVRGDKGVKL